jgi:hypothetical protein
VKDQYVGDVSDFMKYAALRDLDLAPTVVWMRTPADGRSDGGRVGYLDHPELFRPIDPGLFDVLKDMVSGGDRSLGSIESSGVLRGAAYISKLVPDEAKARADYFDDVWAASADRPLVFFDPDNGLGVVSVPKGRRNSSKYVYIDELRDTYARGPSIVVYQHFPRRPREPFIRRLLETVGLATGCMRPLALVTSHVALVVAPQPARQTALHAQLISFAGRAAPFVAFVD